MMVIFRNGSINIRINIYRNPVLPLRWRCDEVSLGEVRSKASLASHTSLFILVENENEFSEEKFLKHLSQNTQDDMNLLFAFPGIIHPNRKSELARTFSRDELR